MYIYICVYIYIYVYIYTYIHTYIHVRACGHRVSRPWCRRGAGVGCGHLARCAGVCVVCIVLCLVVCVAHMACYMAWLAYSGHLGVSSVSASFRRLLLLLRRASFDMLTRVYTRRARVCAHALAHVHTCTCVLRQLTLCVPLVDWHVRLPTRTCTCACQRPPALWFVFLLAQEDVETCHSMYFKAVADIFERHKASCGYPDHQLVRACVRVHARGDGGGCGGRGGGERGEPRPAHYALVVCGGVP